jgi:serine phosphatase RsbU (regulator of sigma subunit)/anti-sigma regulatory factor (Ser/Thr protein kinase)
LSKPVTPTILKAKIDAMMRIRGLYDAVTGQRNERDREMEFAEKVYSQIVYRGSMEETNINYWSSPMAIFSGDILLIARSPAGPVNVIMGDFTGHGLSAAMGAMPASDIFYAMTAKGYSINEIVMELNRKLKQLLPPNIFLAAAMVQLDSDKGMATIWSGAVPDIFVLGKEGGVKNRFKSRNLPLGVVDNELLGSTVEVIALAEGDRLCIFSDGVTEAVRADGEMFEEERLEECLNRYRGDRLLEAVKAAVDKFCEGQSQSDDVTMVEIICDNKAIRPMNVKTPEISGKSAPFDWGMVVELSSGRLREADPLPMIMQVLMEDDVLAQHKENLFLVMSELFTNALDHGVLGMDGSLKKTVEGMVQYLTEREKALASLEAGLIKMEIKHAMHDGERTFVVRVEDSGPGFDYAEQETSRSESSSMGGRGIKLVRSLCKQTVFHGSGNQVEATYLIT